VKPCTNDGYDFLSTESLAKQRDQGAAAMTTDPAAADGRREVVTYWVMGALIGATADDDQIDLSRTGHGQITLHTLGRDYTITIKETPDEQ
jgi:hypothetical protein